MGEAIGGREGTRETGRLAVRTQGLGTEVESLQSQPMVKEGRKRKGQRKENGEEKARIERRNRELGLGKGNGVR